MFNSIIEKLEALYKQVASWGPTEFNTIVTIIAIVLTILSWLKRDKLLSFLLFLFAKFFSGHVVLKNKYYSHNFVLNNVYKSKRLIRIMCVRNERVTEPDIIEAFRKFIVKRGGNLEILALDPAAENCILDNCMNVLPSPPLHTGEFKRQVISNHNRILELSGELGREDKKKLRYYYFNTLPLIHMCQFDSMIYIGFQLFQRDEIDNSLLDYSILIKENSKLGKQIITQFEFVRDNKAYCPIADRNN